MQEGLLKFWRFQFPSTDQLATQPTDTKQEP
jgi:hypothetical protein